MGETFILDTSAVIKYVKGSLSSSGMDLLNRVIEDEPTISIVNRIELLSWKPPVESDLDLFHLFVNNSNHIPLTESIILKTIEVRREYKLKLPDAIIASTALILNRTLLADNDLDFLRVPNLKYINPRSLS